LNLALGLALAKGWADKIPNLLVFCLFLVSVAPIIYWLFTHDKLLRHRVRIRQEFDASPLRVLAIGGLLVAPLIVSCTLGGIWLYRTVVPTTVTSTQANVETPATQPKHSSVADSNPASQSATSQHGSIQGARGVTTAQLSAPPASHQTAKKHARTADRSKTAAEVTTPASQVQQQVQRPAGADMNMLAWVLSGHPAPPQAPDPQLRTGGISIHDNVFSRPQPLPTERQTPSIRVGVGPVSLAHNSFSGPVTVEPGTSLIQADNNRVDGTAVIDNRGGFIGGEVEASGNVIRPPNGGTASVIDNTNGVILKGAKTSNNDIGWPTNSLPIAVALHGSNGAVADQFSGLIEQGNGVIAKFSVDDDTQSLVEKNREWEYEAKAVVRSNLDARLADAFDNVSATTEGAYTGSHGIKGISICNLMRARVALLGRFVDQLRASN
jgi:hypothetical protein